MGEILDLATWVTTPIGAISALAFVTALYFYGRWVLAEPVQKTHLVQK
jgi:hypothetical protein